MTDRVIPYRISCYNQTMNNQTFFFYDLETSGLSPRDSRIMQFAGQRTDMDMNPIGEPVDILVQLADDTLPSPEAIMVTKITPQKTKADGITEKEFCHYVMDEIFTPNTIACGYNSVRFDDEFMRHTFWRNFFDPYEWQWKDGRSRWDLLDVVRLVRALRPEGINWPFQPAVLRDPNTGTTETRLDESGNPVMVPTNRLELITKLNGISHEHAHDALSDVFALIGVTKLIKEHQPKMYDYLFSTRDKKHVAQLVSMEKPQPFVYASGRYSNEHNKTTIVYPIAKGRNGNIIVYDLRHNPEQVASQETFFPAVKELALNKCPAVAPIGVLTVDNGWEKIHLTEEIVRKHLDILKKHPEFIKAATESIMKQPEFPPATDPESALYDGFLSDSDRACCESIRIASAASLNNFHPKFKDARLPGLLLHYKAKNHPDCLTETETMEWEKYRLDRLNRQAPTFLKSLQRLANQPDSDSYIVEELQLWYQSLQGSDY